MWPRENKDKVFEMKYEDSRPTWLVRYTKIGPSLLLEAELDVVSCEAQIVRDHFTDVLRNITDN